MGECVKRLWLLSPRLGHSTCRKSKWENICHLRKNHTRNHAMRKRYISTLHCTGLILHDWCSLWRRCGCHFLLTLIILQEFPTKDESSLFSNNTALHIPCYQSISKYHFNWSFAHWICKNFGKMSKKSITFAYSYRTQVRSLATLVRDATLYSEDKIDQKNLSTSR